MASSGNILIAKNTFLLGIRNVFTLAIYLYSTRVILQTLGVEDYGVYNVVCGFVAMFAFLNTSMSNGIQRFYNYELGKNGINGARRVYLTSLLIQFGLLVVILLLTELIGLWYISYKMVIPAERMHAAMMVFQASISGFAFLILQVPYTASVMAHERMNFYSGMALIDAILKLGCALVLPYLEWDRLIVYGFLISGVSLFNLIVYRIYTAVSFEETRFGFLFDIGLFRSMLLFSGWNIFGSFAGVMKEQGLNMILNLFFGPVVNAARGIAYQVSAGFQSLIGSIHTAVRPQLIQSYAIDNTNRVIRLMELLSKTSSIFLYAISYPILLEIDFVLGIWLGDTIPADTGLFIRIILIINIVNNLNSAVSMIIHATGKMRVYQLVTSSLSLMALPVAYLAFLYNGEAVWGFIICLIFAAISQAASVSIMTRYIDYSAALYIKNILVPIIAVLIVTCWIPLSVLRLMVPGWIRFIIVTLVSVVTIVAAMYLIGLSRQERSELNIYIKRKLHSK